MGAIANRLTFPLDEVKKFLQVDGTDQDLIIQTLFDAAKAQADNFCQNDFLDTLTDAELPIPADVTLWVLQRTARLYERRTEGLSQITEQGIGSVTWGAEEYAALWPYRVNPGF